MERIILSQEYRAKIEAYLAGRPKKKPATRRTRAIRTVANSKFPFVGFTHGGSYTVGNMASAINVNSYMIGHSHLDDQHDPASVIAAVKRMGKDVWIKSLGPVGYSNMKDQLLLWSRSEIAPYVVGFIHTDECNRQPGDGMYASTDTLLAQQQAWHEVFPGKPDVLNLLPNDSMFTYLNIVRPKIAAVDAYLNSTPTCSYINDYDVVEWACNYTLDAYNAAGLTLAAGHCLGFYFQIFQQQRCADEFAAHSVPPYGNSMFDYYFDTVLNAWGNKWGWAAGYAWKDDDEFDGHFPQDHSDIWPSIKHLSTLIYGEGMTTPYNVRTLPDSQPSAVNIASFTASRTYVSETKPDSVLSWDVTGAAQIEIDNGIGVVTGTSLTVTPATTTTYTLKATASNGDVAYAYVTIVFEGTLPTGLGLDFPAIFYCNVPIHGALQNEGSLTISKVSAYRMDQNGWLSAGVCGVDAGGKGFTFTPNNLTGTNFIFQVTFGGVSGVELYEQAFAVIQKPTVSPALLNLTVGQSITLSLVKGAGETIKSASSTAPSIATATGSNLSAVVTAKAAGTAIIVVFPTVLPGYNEADFAIDVPVSVASSTPPVNYVYGEARVLIADNGVSKI